MNKITLAAAALLSIGVAACGSDPFRSSAPVPTTTRTAQAQFGTVTNIEVMDESGRATGVGAVIGGVVGGLLGNQIGDGRGQDIATVAGAVGGAVAGHQIEKRRNAGSNNAYRVAVRLENGASQTFEQDILGDLRVGDRVRIDNNRVERY